MKTPVYTAILTLSLCGFHGAAQADPFADAVQQRLHHQALNIEHGAKDGELTYQEQRKLNKQHNKLAHLADRFYRDGCFDQREKKILRHKLKRVDAHIDRLTHNNVLTVTTRYSDHQYSDIQPKKCDTPTQQNQYGNNWRTYRKNATRYGPVNSIAISW